MARREHIVCDCGGQLSRPLPTHCPYCSAQLTSVRHGWPLGVWFQVLSAIAMFGLLALVAWLLVRK